ncbi:E2F-associated phosphoprotein [Trichinella nelsoni]|uniref:E2F-associated phosphoprotein n=1 Tax=Trichinella nelsoni TaxID=6336 RepID=A0A0V0SJF1_9BILA|nr:E2F-associated phosphoprotein [Trichinella nelsoni]
MERFAPLERDVYFNEDYSDDEKCSDNENDDNELCKSTEKSATFRRSEMNAEFELEMKSELDKVFMEQSVFSSFTSIESIGVQNDNKCAAKGNSVVDDFADPALGLNDKFTASDEEFIDENDMEMKCNDELFYNPKDDEDNQNWINTHRRNYQPQMTSHLPLPKSDAVLNCPACMSLLCLDCQRHVKYSAQYRAMFVQNCDIGWDEILRIPEVKTRKSRRRKENGEQRNAVSTAASTSDDSCFEDTFHPVFCSVCRTEVGVIDRDEVYHFFNVLSSHS